MFPETREGSEIDWLAEVDMPRGADKDTVSGLANGTT